MRLFAVAAQRPAGERLGASVGTVLVHSAAMLADVKQLFVPGERGDAFSGNSFELAKGVRSKATATHQERPARAADWALCGVWVTNGLQSLTRPSKRTALFVSRIDGS